MTIPSLEPFLTKLARWAASRADILALALVGSHARGAARPGSDVDLVLLAVEPPAYLRDSAWVGQFGPVESLQVEDWGALTSLRVLYRGGLEVEFGLARTDWAALPLDAGTRRVIAGGMRILVDKHGLLARAQQEVLRGGGGSARDQA